MNKLIFNAAISSLLALSAYAAPFMAVGTSAEIFVTADVSISANDNVTLGNDFVPPGSTEPFNPELDDIVIRVAPGFSYEFGRNALTSGSFRYFENIDFYSDNSDLDSALSNVLFNVRHDDGNSKTTAAASYRQLNQNTVDLRLPTLSRRDEIKAKLEHEMSVSGKSRIMFGFDWTDVDYSRPTLLDRSEITLPLQYYWEYTPKVDISFGGAYRNTDTDNANASSDDIILSLGARGDFTAKLKGFFRVGYVDRSLDAGGGRSALSLASNFSYLYSEKTTFTAGISNDFGNSGIGENQENFTTYIGFRSEVAPELAFTGRLSFRNIDYFSRGADDYIEGNLGAEYTVNEYFQLIGMFNYKDNDADLESGNFDNTIFSLSAKLRY